jgi:hypothetical protein
MFIFTFSPNVREAARGLGAERALQVDRRRIAPTFENSYERTLLRYRSLSPFFFGVRQPDVARAAAIRHVGRCCAP